MVSRISHTTFDALDSYSQSRFWAAVLGWVENRAKNRVHLDLQAIEGSREDEMARVLSLGAQFVADFRNESGGGWVLLADPEGNEFCILSSEWSPTPFTPVG